MVALPLPEMRAQRGAASGRAHRGLGRRCWLGAGLSVQANRLQPVGVLSLRNHGQRDGRSIQLCMHMPSFKPGTEPWVEDLRLASPEIGLQATLNLEMVQLQFDTGNVFGEIAPDIACSHMQSGDAESPALCFDDHRHLPFLAG